MSTLPHQPADFDTRRFCPFHGGFIQLADCRIVATSTRVVAAATASAMGASTESTLTSDFDGVHRIVLSEPPPAPATAQRRFGRAPVARLPLPAELVGGTSAARARPARACPECGHPLPAGIDVRDPISISLVGHSGASKTTTLVALAELVRTAGPGLIGLDEFMPTEATAEHFRTVMGRYREPGGRVTETYKHQLHHPMEFFAAPGRYNQPINILFHDVAGEQLMDRDLRLETAPAVLWSDLVIFFYNPEESPRLNLLPTGRDQAVLLNGVHEDIVAFTKRNNPRDGAPLVPPLILLLCKTDLLQHEIGRDVTQGDAVRTAIGDLGDGDVIAAGQRWPEVYWHAISAQPVDGGRPRGVIEVFRVASQLIRARA